MAAALIEVEIRGRWLQTEFWRDHWCMAASQALPVGLSVACGACWPAPRSRICQRCLAPGAQTHQQPGRHPPWPAWTGWSAAGRRWHASEWSRGSALPLLGPEYKAWIARFDRQWCAANATEWKLHHAWLQRVRAVPRPLQAGMAQASAADLVELARLRKHLNPRADVRPLYELALERSAEHPGALRGCCRRCLRGPRKPGWPACTVCGTWAATTAGGPPARRWPSWKPRMGYDHDAAAFKNNGASGWSAPRNRRSAPGKS